MICSSAVFLILCFLKCWKFLHLAAGGGAGLLLNRTITTWRKIVVLFRNVTCIVTCSWAETFILYLSRPFGALHCWLMQGRFTSYLYFADLEKKGERYFECWLADHRFQNTCRWEGIGSDIKMSWFRTSLITTIILDSKQT